eukprot:Gb_16004 [translate_table: standard]
MEPFCYKRFLIEYLEAVYTVIVFLSFRNMFSSSCSAGLVLLRFIVICYALVLMSVRSYSGEANIMDFSGGGSSSMDPEELGGLFDVMETILDDPSWRSNHPHPCTDNPWPGIGCEASPDNVLHVTKLHIGMDFTAGCRKDAKLASAVLKLRFLKRLFIFKCFQASNTTIPSELVKLSSSLEELVLKSNAALLGLIPPELAGLRKLRVLSLSQNGLEGRIPIELGKLEKLQHLDLSYNKLSGRIPDDFRGLKSLSILDLSGNELQGSLPPSMGSLRSLQKIDVSSNNLSGRIPPELGKLKDLCFLALSQNMFSGPFPHTFQALTNLQYLMVEGNPMNCTLPNFFGALTKLSELSLSSSGFEGPIPKSFCALNNLTALALDNNRLNGSIPSDLGALQHLYQLNLSWNLLRGEVTFSQSFIQRLGNKLDLRGNQDLCVKKALSVGKIRRCSNSTTFDQHGKGSDDITAGLDEPMLHPNCAFSRLNSSRIFQIFLWVACMVLPWL